MKTHLACLEAQERGTSLLHWCRLRISLFYILLLQATNLTNKQSPMVPFLGFVIYFGPRISAEVEQVQHGVMCVHSHYAPVFAADSWCHVRGFFHSHLLIKATLFGLTWGVQRPKYCDPIRIASHRRKKNNWLADTEPKSLPVIIAGGQLVYAYSTCLSFCWPVSNLPEWRLKGRNTDLLLQIFKFPSKSILIQQNMQVWT